MKREKMTIRSDGTGAGTVVTVGDVQVDGIRSLFIEVPGRDKTVRLTMELELHFWMNASVVWHGEFPTNESDGLPQTGVATESTERLASDHGEGAVAGETGSDRKGRDEVRRGGGEKGEGVRDGE